MQDPIKNATPTESDITNKLRSVFSEAEDVLNLVHNSIKTFTVYLNAAQKLYNALYIIKHSDGYTYRSECKGYGQSFVLSSRRIRFNEKYITLKNLININLYDYKELLYSFLKFSAAMSTKLFMPSFTPFEQLIDYFSSLPDLKANAPLPSAPLSPAPLSFAPSSPEPPFYVTRCSDLSIDNKEDKDKKELSINYFNEKINAIIDVGQKFAKDITQLILLAFSSKELSEQLGSLFTVQELEAIGKILDVKINEDNRNEKKNIIAGGILRERQLIDAESQLNLIFEDMRAKNFLCSRFDNKHYPCHKDNKDSKDSNVSFEYCDIMKIMSCQDLKDEFIAKLIKLKNLRDSIKESNNKLLETYIMAHHRISSC